MSQYCFAATITYHLMLIAGINFNYFLPGKVNLFLLCYIFYVFPQIFKKADMFLILIFSLCQIVLHGRECYTP